MIDIAAADTPAKRQDPFAQYGRNLAEHLFNKRIGSLPVDMQGHSWAALDNSKHPKFNVQAEHDGVVRVGILGGGMAGLYTALMLADRGIPFQILEATPRLGGRCWTYHFEEGGEWDYYDVGAMRFPLPKDGEIGPHLRLKQLFDRLGLSLFDYIYKEDKGFMYFNGVRTDIGDTTQRFKAQDLGVPNPYLDAGVKTILNDYMTPLVDLLLKDMETGSDNGWRTLKEEYDQYSTRSYLQFKYVPTEKLRETYGLPATGLPTCVVDWLETFDKSTGWYDRALTETVLEALAFGAYGHKPEWHCIQGGTSVLPKKTLELVRSIAKNIQGMPEELIVYDSPVTAIWPSDAEDKTSPLVVRNSHGDEFKFSHVISSVPLPNFALIDTSKLSMKLMQRNAIRQLQYGPSIKVGMLFKTAWWKEYGQVGGQSFTDLPIRTVVYPSYGPDKESKVLIASYCWTNDAERLGNLIGSGVDDLLTDLVLRDLTLVHGIEDPDFLRKQLVRSYAWNWNHDAWTGGAFAFFGPGQYEYLYDALTATAAEGRLQWAGELLSVRHAWIVGALDSAWAAVDKYLYLSNNADKLEGFYKTWGTNLEWDLGHSVGKNEGESDGPGAKLPIPHTRNLLLAHMIAHDPDLVVNPAETQSGANGI